MDRRKKKPRRLENDLGEVWTCRCGGINVGLGNVTMHFSVDEFRDLARLVRGAAAWVEPAKAAPTEPEAPTPPPKPGKLLH